jgi:hypothetical protein
MMELVVSDTVTTAEAASKLHDETAPAGDAVATPTATVAARRSAAIEPRVRGWRVRAFTRASCTLLCLLSLVDPSL